MALSLFVRLCVWRCECLQLPPDHGSQVLCFYGGRNWSERGSGVSRSGMMGQMAGVPGCQWLERPEWRTPSASHRSQTRDQKSVCSWCSSWSKCGWASQHVSNRSSWTSQQINELARNSGMSLKARSGGRWLGGTILYIHVYIFPLIDLHLDQPEQGTG